MFRIHKQSRYDYWSCSKFADLIRGTKKPFALEWEAWDKWREKASQKHRIRYWIAEKLLGTLQDIYCFPSDLYNTIRNYIRNRFIDKTHCLKTGLKPGQYYDLDHRIIHGLFNELVELVEIEYAHRAMWDMWDDKNKYKLIHGRCKEAGLDYLNWAGQLVYDDSYGFAKEDSLYGKPTAQAVSAQKTLELYHWWKNRDNRADPYKLFTEDKDGKYYFKKIAKMEDSYDKEDTKMLIKLIKIRGSLWT